MRPLSLVSLAVLALCLAPSAGCRPSTPAPDPERGDTAGAEEGERDGRRRRRARASEDYPLDERVAVRGTGASLRAPRGSEPMPVGSGFLHARRRVQILVVASQGPAELHDAVRASLAEGAVDEIAREEVTIAGQEVELITDLQENGPLELERVWTMVRLGERSVVVIGAYAADRADRLRGLVRAALLTLEVDAEAALEPELALGYRLAAVEGLEVDRSTSRNVTYLGPDHEVPPSYREPMLHLASVPIDVPPSERAGSCAEILSQIGPIPSGPGSTTAAIDEGAVTGCEVRGRMSEPLDLATYAALLWRDDQAFIVYGAIVYEQREPWIERYRAAARSLGPAPAAAPAP